MSRSQELAEMLSKCGVVNLKPLRFGWKLDQLGVRNRGRQGRGIFERMEWIRVIRQNQNGRLNAL